ncbi:hypothetical protein GWK47_048843 [Chionoecetes opilio]|uniref:Uncharacterized protein n=1 Tax=Chionoecetes opilio TaxID=41210 RepID=A0A8J4YBL0_CHIOP|nr:hypothetical protein GWK47_048843 [Chionoecetes opilio]
MACERRSTDVVWLLEKSPTSSFPGNRLPSRGEVSRCFFSHHKIQRGSFLLQQLLPLRRFWESVATCEHSDVDVSGGGRKDPNCTGVGAPWGIRPEDREKEIKRSLPRQPRRHVHIAHSKARERRSPGRKGLSGG